MREREGGGRVMVGVTKLVFEYAIGAVTTDLAEIRVAEFTSYADITVLRLSYPYISKVNDSELSTKNYFCSFFPFHFFFLVVIKFINLTKRIFLFCHF